MAGLLMDRLKQRTERDHVLRLSEPPATVKSFLGRLSLLHGVPFAYLVPSAAQLPAESLRFFHIDPLWMASLLDGALSLGRWGDRAFLLGKSTDGNYLDILETARKLRQPDRPLDAARVDRQVAGSRFTGFLLRSRLLTAWPGMELRAYPAGSTGEDAGPELVFLHLARPDREVLLGIVDGEIGRLDIIQPAEGLQFDLRPKSAGPDTLTDPAKLARNLSLDTTTRNGSARFAQMLMAGRNRFVFHLGEGA